MLFLSSTAFILMWFDISIFIFLKFIILGGLKSMGNISSASIVDDIDVSCVYSNANNVIISGAEQFGDLITINNDGGIYNKVQLYIEASIGGIFLRVKENNSWMPWHKILSDVPSFYKNYADLSSLLSALGNVNKNPSLVRYYKSNGTDYADFNSYVEHGFYQVIDAASKANSPVSSGHGFIMNFAWENTRIMQFYFGGSGQTGIWTRNCINNIWGSWHTIWEMS